ncbi:Pantothenate synthetase [Jeotgalicoccus aerolatus]|uniref:Pantothenate synthetase n=1 Tax=Jeotgalicoccus aerolatus TaxID=709510 RepID=A0ABS4HKW3_9STAP|nr:pantoate--beta-alanine ligase [Jeotgalicoccus aerolatus]MBP1951565.1 pantoate--beta-alanine ligase [Jeotgalicoccus aerolatus]NMA80513.1 pantoate--beta-alanine ligase [Jeotgalicoccus aerolatus]CAD2076106.1 Pantothenate synthetase [Jeotgalicoccus aerolatus]GGD96567.1 pantothenate synthetase [Jeotgalicoccus aerolatus]HJG32818.1 pantoate--beta-alanine ligase [Jeotgalicoccus aerolatus]
MQHTASIKEARLLLSSYKDKKIALVPTMGYLHEGHMALIKEAKKHADIVAVSIFVNPLQFGPDEDYDSYPRDLERDLGICEAEGADIVFHPEVSEMYPGEMEFKIGINTMADVLDGVKRPGHFEGVVTVIGKLFNIIQPDIAVFGQKDRQQLMIIEQFTSDFNIPVKIIGVPTEREESGLAKSSRNVNLSEAEFNEASEIYTALLNAGEQIKNGTVNTDKIMSFIKLHIEQQTSGTVDDLAIYTAHGLKSVEYIDEDVIIFIAVQFKKARLIDNLYVSL